MTRKYRWMKLTVNYTLKEKFRQYKYNIKITKMTYTGTKGLNLNKIASP